MHGLRQSQARAGCVDDPIVDCLRRLLDRPSVDIQSGRNPELVFVMPVLVNFGAVSFQNLTDQQAEFAIPEHGHGRAGGNADLIEDLAGSGQGFDEDGLVGGDLARHPV